MLAQFAGLVADERHLATGDWYLAAILPVLVGPFAGRWWIAESQRVMMWADGAATFCAWC
jgi:hypothetical protein